MHADTSRFGAVFLSKRAADNPREMFIKIFEENKQISKDELFKLLQSELESDPAYQRAVNWYFFVNMYEYASRDRSAPSIQQREQQRAATQLAEVQISRMVENIKGQIILLDLTMTNGKPMRDCTGAEMAIMGNRFQKIAKRVGKTETVGSMLSEEQVKAILA
jgi:hypothetical protein